MKRDLALRCLRHHVKPDDILVAVYQTLFDWIGIAPRELNYVSTGAMGQGSSHGLGLAIANPDRRVIILDGDGSLLMNLGSLASIADAAPTNLFHFVFVNGTYEVNGGHPIPARGKLDFAAMALACGYRRAIRLETLDELGSIAGNIFAQDGPSLFALDVEPGQTFPRDYGYIHSETARKTFREALNRT